MKKRTDKSTKTPIEIARQAKRDSYGRKEIPNFCRNVLEKRLELGLSQEALANLIGASRPRISNIESGVFPTEPDRIIALSKALDVSLDWLFTHVPEEK